MKNKSILIAVSLTIFIVLCFYVITFHRIFGFQLSGDTAVWGQFGDYVGGTLNPILSFTSILLLIRSVSLQKEANDELKNELENSEKTERFRSFNSLFFSMIESQRILVKELVIVFNIQSSSVSENGVAAIIRLEDQIEAIRSKGATEHCTGKYIEKLDRNDQIFGIVRAFYITVKMICEKLDGNHGFDDRERKEQILTLINLTDFAQLRLILIGIQFLDYPSSRYLKNNGLFMDAATESRLKIGSY